MKVFIPKNIKWWMFSMRIQIWPFSMSIIQLFVVATGAAISLSVWNSLVRSGIDKVIASILALPIVILFGVVAFFNISELPLIPFIAKLIRTYFIDEPVKYQLNYKKIDKTDIMVKLVKNSENAYIVESKDLKIDQEKIKSLDDL